MITTIRLDTIEKVLNLLQQQEYKTEIDRHRSLYFYLGMPNADFHLDTSLKRNCKEHYRELEKAMLRNFTKYAVIEDPGLANDVWRQLIVGRHHGLASRLQDWTHSPLISLHFATTGESLSKMDEHDAVIWRVDIREINKKLPEKYRAELEKNKAHIFTLDMLNSVVSNLEEYDRDMGGRSMVLLEPPSIDERIVNQYSHFFIVPSDMEDIERFIDENTEGTIKYIVDKNLKWRIRDMLDQLNVTERMIFPGLDGLTAWLNRHYYVK